MYARRTLCLQTAAKSAAAAELKTPVVAWAQHFLYDKSEWSEALSVYGRTSRPLAARSSQ